MNKTKFLKEAQKKYKEQLEKKFVSEMNFIFSDELILRVWFDVNFIPNKEFGETGFMHRWCKVDTLPSSEDKKIENEMGHFLSNESKDFPAIIKTLRKELIDNADELIDYIKFAEGEDDAIETTITPIQTLESTYSVKNFCDLIGIG